MKCLTYAQVGNYSFAVCNVRIFYKPVQHLSFGINVSNMTLFHSRSELVDRLKDLHSIKNNIGIMAQKQQEW